VLAEAEALGLELIEVRRLPPDEAREPSLNLLRAGIHRR